MAKLSDLVTTVAGSTETAESAVKEVARRLREGKLIQTGKVGRYGGSQMTPGDAAALIVGLMVSRASDSSMGNLPQVTREVLTGKPYRSDPQWRPGGWPRDLNLPFLSKLGSGHSLKDAVTALIVSAIDGVNDIDPNEHVLEIHYAPTHPHAVVTLKNFALFYARVKFPIRMPRLTVSAELMFDTIQDIGDLLAPGGQG